MQLWHRTRNDHSDLTDGRDGGGKSNRYDSGCAGGEHFALWPVYFLSQSTGGSGHSRSTRRPDTTALYADGGGDMDPYQTDRTRRGKTLSDE